MAREEINGKGRYFPDIGMDNEMMARMQGDNAKVYYQKQKQKQKHRSAKSESERICTGLVWECCPWFVSVMQANSF